MLDAPVFVCLCVKANIDHRLEYNEHHGYHTKQRQNEYSTFESNGSDSNWYSDQQLKNCEEQSDLDDSKVA